MRYPQGIGSDVAAQAHHSDARVHRVFQPLGECRIGIAVRCEHAHAGHLHDEHGVGLEPLGDASLQSAEVFPPALCGGIREHADPVGLLCDTLDLGEDATASGFDVEVEPGVPMLALRTDDGPVSERFPIGQVLGEDPVGGLGVDVDQQIVLPGGHKVVPVPPRGVVRCREDDACPGQEDLPAPSGVLDVDADLLPVEEDCGDEPVLPVDELRLHRPLVAHGQVKNRHY